MYRITEIKTGIMYPMIELRYVCQGENGWERCEESEFISVPIFGVCRIYDGTIDEDSEYPLVIIVEDNGMLLNELCTDSKGHTTQIADIEYGTVDLANAVEETTIEVQDAIVEYASVFETLVERVAQLEEIVQELRGGTT